MAKRKMYTEEFKRQAVERAEKGEKNIAELERELGLSQGTISRWRRQLQGEQLPQDTASKPKPSESALTATVTPVNSDRTCMRKSPNSRSVIRSILRRGSTITLIGRNADASWVVSETDAGTFWVDVDDLTIDRDVSSLPVLPHEAPLEGTRGTESSSRKRDSEWEELKAKQARRLGKTASNRNFAPITSSTRDTSGFSEAATYDGNAEFYANQYAQVGEIVDMWADLIEGYAAKTTDFWQAFKTHFEARGLTGYSPRSDYLTATGLFAPYRKMEFVRRGVVTIPIYIAVQGKDLYISWRAFVQGQISLIKVVGWLIICLLLTFPFALEEKYEQFGEVSTTLNSGKCLSSFVMVVVVTGVIAAAYGFFYRQGDWQALWREPLNELQVDDVASLSSAVHYSLIAAADQVGIDTTKLQAREPFYTPRGRRRRI